MVCVCMGTGQTKTFDVYILSHPCPQSAGLSEAYPVLELLIKVAHLDNPL